MMPVFFALIWNLHISGHCNSLIRTALFQLRQGARAEGGTRRCFFLSFLSFLFVALCYSIFEFISLFIVFKWVAIHHHYLQRADAVHGKERASKAKVMTGKAAVDWLACPVDTNQKGIEIDDQSLFLSLLLFLHFFLLFILPLFLIRTPQSEENRQHINEPASWATD
jgi:hypothetical protein